jgi:hypothetical protein
MDLVLSEVRSWDRSWGRGEFVFACGVKSGVRDVVRDPTDLFLIGYSPYG